MIRETKSNYCIFGQYPRKSTIRIAGQCDVAINIFKMNIKKEKFQLYRLMTLHLLTASHRRIQVLQDGFGENSNYIK